MSYAEQINISKNDLGYDSWGRSKSIKDISILHGVWSYDVPLDIWKKKINGIEVYAGEADNSIRAINGHLALRSEDGSRYTLSSKRHPRYQPNRGHIFSDSSWIPNASGGTLYVVKRTTVNGTTIDSRVPISYTADLTKGNVFDIQMQWRGVGDFTYYINLKEVYKQNQLGTLTELSISNPALPISYEVVKGSHTLGGLTRSNSAVRWGLFTEQNGIFFEYEYTSPTTNAYINVGCTDVSSEGGQLESKAYTSVSAEVNGISGLVPLLAVRVPSTRVILDDNGDTSLTYNTRDLILSSLNIASTTKTSIYMYVGRDPAGLSGVVWSTNYSNDVQFSTNGAITSYNVSKMSGIFETVVEQAVPYAKKNPLGSDGYFWLTNSDYIFIMAYSQQAATIHISLEFGVER